MDQRHSDETDLLPRHSPGHSDPLPTGLVLGGPVSTKDTTTTVVAKSSLTGTGTKNLTTGTQGYVFLPDQGKHAHNLPKLEAPARGTTIDRNKAFP